MFAPSYKNYKEDNVHRFTRNDLYELVWTQPAIKIVEKYDISDSWLTKICYKMEIPKPPRGYWAKIQAGAKEKKELLPKASKDCELVTVLPLLTEEAKLAKLNSVSTIQESEADKVTVLSRIGKLHPMVQKTKSVLEKGTLDEYNVINTRWNDVLSVRVSKTLIPRAIRILDAIAKEVERRSYKLGLEHEDWSGKYNSYIEAAGHKFKFILEEECKRSEYTPTKEELQRGGGFQKYNYTPTGIFTLRLEVHGYYDIPTKFTDNKSGLIEDKLSQFFICLKQLIVLKEKERLERQEEARLSEIRRKEAAEIERQRQERLAKIRKLETDADNYEKSQKIKSYIAYRGLSLI